MKDYRVETHRRWCECHPDKVDEEIERTRTFIKSMREIYKESDAEAREKIAKAMEGFTVRLKVMEEWKEERANGVS